MSKKERDQLIKLIHLAYNDIIDENKQLAEYLMQDYLKIEKENQNYKIVACKMQGYLNKYLLSKKNKSTNIVKLSELVNKIYNSYNTFSAINIWF